ncbi:uncharacterized protein LOC116248916 isoform X2 [Nymphaea colorata]|uniref:uncharacterized protein LOC116248916 isoform X2 n=1 Tax=Nymphaea colorata TaxID=210225 RepID=UPI00129D715F|nr:uncharacterized protein LOC116248916 isoform X2 [Nymphaea colorata]
MGTKRRVESDSNAEPLDSTLRSKRVIAGPPFDLQRARSSQQHVRALNMQFASWVQSQLQNHPDELWEDGVQDYLRHASQIMEKFSDVVEWLKANSTDAESLPNSSPPDLEKKVTTDIWAGADLPKSDNKSFTFPSPFFGSNGSGPGFSISMLNTKSGSAPFSFASSQVPGQGSKSLAPVVTETAEDVNDDDETEQPSSPSLKRTEEHGIVVVHEVKCKLYVKVGKVLLNALIYPSIKMNVQKNTITTIFHTLAVGDTSGSESGTAVARTYLLRTKTEEEINKLAESIREYTPSS